MRRLVISAALALAAVSAPAAAQADSAADFNLFVLGQMTGLNSSTQGRVAVGGNASVTNYSIGAGAAAGQANFVVGGNLTTAQSLNLNGGQTVVGGTATSQWGSPNIQAPGTALPVDFAAEALRLTTLSSDLADYDANGVTNYFLPAWAQPNQHHGQITMTGTQSGLNVFTLDGARLGDASAFTINLAPGSTALINVTGTNASYFQTTMNIIGGNASSLLWNFSEATNLSFYNTGNGFQGSVLAPLATYSPAGWGAINGQLIVKNFTSSNGSTALNNVAFAGDLLKPSLLPSGPGGAVPEPATWAMMILGFGAVGSLLRRRRSAGAALA